MRHCDDAILTGVDRCTLSTNGLVLDCRSALPLPENAPPIVCAIDSQLSRHLAFARRQTIVRLGNEADNGLSSRAAARAAIVAAPAPHYAHRERMRAKATAIIALQIIDGDFLRDYWASSQYWQCAAPRDPTLTRAVREWSPFLFCDHPQRSVPRSSGGQGSYSLGQRSSSPALFPHARFPRRWASRRRGTQDLPFWAAKRPRNVRWT